YGWVLALFPLVCGSQQPDQPVTFSVTSRLVVVNVDVRDRNGQTVGDLKKEDFQLLENGQSQQISVFEYQRLTAPGTPVVKAMVARGSEAAPSVPAASTTATAPAAPAAPVSKTPLRHRDRRLIVLFFDLSSMQADEQVRAQRAAREFVAEKMTPSDLVAVMTYSTKMKVLQQFTDDRDLLTNVVSSFHVGETSELAGLGATSSDESSEDTGSAYTADETEFNIFNTDRKLSALESTAKLLATMPEKKALVYFSGGISKTGVENESQLRSTINAAVRGNVSFYPIDARGLVAEAPAGDASTGSAGGSGMYSGAAQKQRQEQFAGQQETLFTLAADTGGEVLLDTNDLKTGIIKAQEDISNYYILGYYSSNPNEDGRYRRIEVRVKSQPKAKLDYRAGYYAPRKFRDFSSADRERQLEEALMLDDPITDLPIALEVNYFRRAADRYIVPVALKIPGSEIELARKRDREVTRLDFIGHVRTKQGRMMGAVRDNIQVKLTGVNIGELMRRQLQYDTVFTLPPGEYRLKFLVRENETGKMGTFETAFSIPNLSQEKSYLRLSSVVWANQREAVKAAVGSAGRNDKAFKKHPLVQEGYKLIPSITKVVRKDQKLYVYFEVYGDSKAASAPDVETTVSVFRGKVKAFESKPLHLTVDSGKNSGILTAEIELPLDQLDPGSYVCQVNVVDLSNRKFVFRRSPLVLLPPREETPAAAAGGNTLAGSR
ncbi:MAG: VWA domain-containing protein, partial [Bryobacteraceae bacterium]